MQAHSASSLPFDAQSTRIGLITYRQVHPVVPGIHKGGGGAGTTTATSKPPKAATPTVRVQESGDLPHIQATLPTPTSKATTKPSSATSRFRRAVHKLPLCSIPTPASAAAASKPTAPERIPTSRKLGAHTLEHLRIRTGLGE